MITDSSKMLPASQSRTQRRIAVASEQKQEHAKGRIAKKSKQPSRPLSAYNLFFRSERERIKKVIQAGKPPQDYIQHVQEALRRVKRKTSAAEFQATASTIAKRWKDLPREERSKFDKLAEDEMERYKEKKYQYHCTLVRECAAAAKKASLEETTAPQISHSGTLETQEQEPCNTKGKDTTMPVVAQAESVVLLSPTLPAGQSSWVNQRLPGLARLPSFHQGNSATARCVPYLEGNQYQKTTSCPLPHPVDTNCQGQEGPEAARSRMLKQYDDLIESLEIQILQERLRLKAHQDERTRLEHHMGLFGRRYELHRQEKNWLEHQASVMGQRTTFSPSFFARRPSTFPYNNDIQLEQQPDLVEILRSRLHAGTRM